jgi:hypothetical protein
MQIYWHPINIIDELHFHTGTEETSHLEAQRLINKERSWEDKASSNLSIKITSQRLGIKFKELLSNLFQIKYTGQQTFVQILTRTTVYQTKKLEILAPSKITYHQS